MGSRVQEYFQAFSLTGSFQVYNLAKFIQDFIQVPPGATRPRVLAQLRQSKIYRFFFPAESPKNNFAANFVDTLRKRTSIRESRDNYNKIIHSSTRTMSSSCRLTIHDFANATNNSYLLNELWRCRVCSMLPGQHSTSRRHVQRQSVETNENKRNGQSTECTIYVDLVTGEQVALRVFLSYTIQQVKEMLNNSINEGTPPDQQRFLFSNERLYEGRTLFSFGIRNGSHIMMSPEQYGDVGEWVNDTYEEMNDITFLDAYGGVNFAVPKRPHGCTLNCSKMMDIALKKLKNTDGMTIPQVVTMDVLDGKMHQDLIQFIDFLDQSESQIGDDRKWEMNLSTATLKMKGDQWKLLVSRVQEEIFNEKGVSITTVIFRKTIGKKCVPKFIPFHFDEAQLTATIPLISNERNETAENGGHFLYYNPSMKDVSIMKYDSTGIISVHDGRCFHGCTSFIGNTARYRVFFLHNPFLLLSE